MIVQILNECGYFPALLGLSLSYNQDVGKMPAVAEKLYNKGMGHNKFLESVVVWIDISAPRYWWCQMDTYRVGTTKQSESTMHTIMRHPFKTEDFEFGMEDGVLDILNYYREAKAFDKVKQILPESYIQRRIVCTNYMALRNMIAQRMTHKLPEWMFFCSSILEQVEHPEFFIDLKERFENE